MNKIQYLFQLLQEESSEIIQASSKCNRFGWHSVNQSSKIQMTNFEHVVVELNDLFAIVQMLKDVGFDLTAFGNQEAIDAKIAQVTHYMQDSINEGLLDA